MMRGMLTRGKRWHGFALKGRFDWWHGYPGNSQDRCRHGNGKKPDSHVNFVIGGMPCIGTVLINQAIHASVDSFADSRMLTMVCGNRRWLKSNWRPS